MKSAHIVLTGPRAVGKSTIGRAVARRLEMEFVDLDDKVLEGFSQSTVTEVWQRHGESGWREVEGEVLRDLLQAPPMVLALGGGVPTIDQATKDLNEARRRESAMVIWLQADPAKLAARLEVSSGDRPSLTGKSPAEEIEQVCRDRASSYEAVSDVSLDVGSMDLPQAVQSILDVIR